MIYRFITPHGKFLRLMCIGAHNHGNMVLGDLLQQVVGGIVVGTTAFVDATGIDFDDEVLLANEFYAVVGQFRVPILLFGKEAFLVMHLDFIEMSDNVKLLSFNHFKSLFPESGDGLADVIAEKVVKSLVVDFTLGAVDEPDIVAVVGTHQMHPTDDVIEMKCVLVEGEGLGHAGDEIAFQSFEQLQIRVLLLQRVDGGRIIGDGRFADTELILERDGRMRRETELMIMQLGSFFHKTLQRIFTVAVGGMGVIVVFHSTKKYNGQRY